MNDSSPQIVFTGGGTGGHVTKNTILLELLKEQHPEVGRHYLGLAKGPEASLVGAELADFHPISSGKLRRYFSLQTVPDAFRFVRGIGQAYRKLGKIKPQLVFSSGGFVALPVALAARMQGIPVISHETDSYPGLANRLISKAAEKILLGYESAAEYFPAGKTHFVGNPVSPRILAGSRERGLDTLGFSPEKKILMVIGGSQGAREINELIWEVLPELLKDWQVVHIVGPGKLVGSRKSEVGGRKSNTDGYKAYEYVKEEYADFLAAADLVVSRGGGNSLAELAALGKPTIVIPLDKSIAAGDHQRKNAEEMAQRYASWKVLNGPTADELLQAIQTMPTADGISQQDLQNPEHSQDMILELLKEWF